ncbi:MAG: hypothetical protein KJ568_01350, partial [Actinobacteria bacterium]|nr:hypothetical protein [Actinomycetota bacterium]
LILSKKDLEEKISAFGRKSNNRFELAIAFLKEANQAEKYAQQENWFELPHCRPHAGVRFQKCLQNCGKIPCRGATRRGNIFQFR